MLMEKYSTGERVRLKHHSYTKNIPRYYKDHEAGDLFDVIDRIQTTPMNTKYLVKSVDTGKLYKVQSYHIQKADLPLKKVIRVKKGLTGMQLCSNCNKEFSLKAPGVSHRDHCPYCLHSVHIDKRPGDREVWCGEGEIGSPDYKHSRLIPIGKFTNNKGIYSIKYKCEKCGKIKYNNQALDDSEKELDKLPLVTPPARAKTYV